MKRLLCFAATCLLAACATQPELPKEVRIPVTVYCKVEKPKTPAWLTDTLKPGADIFDQSKALLAERKQRIGYEGELEAAIAGCQPPQPQ